MAFIQETTNEIERYRLAGHSRDQVERFVNDTTAQLTAEGMTGPEIREFMGVPAFNQREVRQGTDQLVGRAGEESLLELFKPKDVQGDFKEMLAQDDPPVELPAEVRQSYMKRLRSGEVQSIKDFWPGFTSALDRSVAYRARTAPSNEAGQILPGLKKTAEQLDGMAFVGEALSKTVPDAQEFYDAAVLIGEDDAPAIRSRLFDLYSDSGVRPADVYFASEKDPKVAEWIKAEPQVYDAEQKLKPKEIGPLLTRDQYTQVKAMREESLANQRALRDMGDIRGVVRESKRELFLAETLDAYEKNQRAGLARSLENLGQVYPVLETAATLATTSYGLPISGLTMLLASPVVGLERAEKAGEWVAGKLIYNPMTRRGQEFTQSTFYPIEKLTELSEFAGDVAYESTGSPAIGAAVKTAIEGAPIVPGGRMALKKARTKGQKQAATRKKIESDIIKEEFGKRFGPHADKIRSILEKAGETELAKRLTTKGKVDILEARRLSRYEKGKRGKIEGVIPEEPGRSSLSGDGGPRFHRSLKEVNESHPYGKAVEVKDPSFYTDPKNKLFMAEDATAGIAVTVEGDMVSVFKTKGSKADAQPLIAEASNHATTLDAFDINGHLPQTYGRHGWRPVGRLKFDREFAPEGWDYARLGEPDMVFMVRDITGKTGLLEVPSRKAGGWATIKNKVPMFDDFEALLKARDVAAKKVSPRIDALQTALQTEGAGELAALMEAARAKKTPGPTFYGGLPFHKIAKWWEDKPGTWLWDRLIIKGSQKLIEKIPKVGPEVIRWFDRDYRSNLSNPEKFVGSLDAMKRNQAIGTEYAIDLGNRLQAIEEVGQLRVADHIKGRRGNPNLRPNELALAEEAKNILYDLGQQAVDMNLLSEEVFFKNAGRYMPRLYRSKEKYNELLTKYNMSKPARLELSRFQRRKDIPKKVRQEMGEILTPGYPVAKGIIQLTHDIEMARFFKHIADDSAWSLKQPKLKAELANVAGTDYGVWHGDKVLKVFKGKGARKDAYQFLRMKQDQLAKPIPEGWKKVPADKKLGQLQDAYVHPEIFKELEMVLHVRNTAAKVWRRTLGAWKFGKVILSPKTHMRNLFSNSVLAHLGGMPMYEQPVYLTKAAKQMREKKEFWQAAKKEGLLGTTFTEAELGALFDGIEGKLEGLAANGIPEKLGVIGDAWSKAGKQLNKAAKLYEAEEQWFKMAKFIHNIERGGMTPKAAAANAEKWLFNYGKLTRFQEKYRSHVLGAPFATFTFKALPRIAEAGVKTPHRFMLPAAMIWGIEEAARAYLESRGIVEPEGMEEAKEGLLPDWMAGSLLGMPNFPRVPIIDDHGREYYLNLTYMLPWGDIAESGSFMFIPGGLRPFSQPFINEPLQIMNNFDFFWGEEIYKEKDLEGLSGFDQQIVKNTARLKHIFNTLAPTPFIDAQKIWAASGISGDTMDYRGRERPTISVALDVLAGIKTYPVDYQQQAARRAKTMEDNARSVMFDIKVMQNKKEKLEEAGRSGSHYDKDIEDKMEQLDKIRKRFEKLEALADKAGAN